MFGCNYGHAAKVQGEPNMGVSVMIQPDGAITVTADNHAKERSFDLTFSDKDGATDTLTVTVKKGDVSKPGNWQAFKSSAGNYSVEMPGYPYEHVANGKSEEGPTVAAGGVDRQRRWTSKFVKLRESFRQIRRPNSSKRGM